MAEQKSSPSAPVILAIGGHDPVGGAGIQADIETVAALGCHAAAAITCLTVQDTRNVRYLAPVDPKITVEQAKAVLTDMAVAAIKIGLIGNAATASRLAQLLADYPTIPVVFDPVLAAGGGKRLANDDLCHSLVHQLLPKVDLLTPNSEEARRLAGMRPLEQCAGRLLERGCGHVLITGTHEAGPTVVNTLYGPDGLVGEREWEWDRLAGEFHGSGCTLAAAIATLLGKGCPLEDAVREGQAYCWQSLAHGRRLGQGQMLPNRLHHLLPTA